MKIGPLFFIAGIPIFFGAVGAFLNDKEVINKLNKSIEKAKIQIEEKKKKPRMMSDIPRRKNTAIYHILKRQKSCRLQVSIDEKTWNIEEVVKEKDITQHDLWKKLQTTIWNSYEANIVKKACSNSKNVILRLHSSLLWRNWNYWEVVVINKKGKESYRSWFWQH